MKGAASVVTNAYRRSEILPRVMDSILRVSAK